MATDATVNPFITDLLNKLVGTMSNTSTNENLGVKNLINQLTTGQQTGTTNQTQQTSADLSKLNQVFAQQQAGISPDALKAIFTEGAKQVPGLVASTANAVGAR